MFVNTRGIDLASREVSFALKGSLSPHACCPGTVKRIYRYTKDRPRRVDGIRRMEHLVGRAETRDADRRAAPEGENRLARYLADVVAVRLANGFDGSGI